MSGASRLRVRDELIEALIAATPSLRELFILDALPFQRFPHPAVRRCIAAGEIEGLAVTPPHPVLARNLAVLLERSTPRPTRASCSRTWTPGSPSSRAPRSPTAPTRPA